MAERRMFAKTIIDSDAFLDMPTSAQALYFHLAMRADDDGFVNNPKKILRTIGANDDDAKLLIAKRFVIPFDSGVVVIKHWRIHNYIQTDRYKPTVYKSEMETPRLKDNGSYSLNEGTPCIGDVSSLDTECIQNVSNLDTQVRLGKESTDKDSQGKRKTINAAIADLSVSDALKQTLKDFAEMRSKIKRPLTDRGLSILMTKLNGIATDEKTQIAILDQSIVHDWQSVYPLKERPTEHDPELDAIFGGAK
jgi:hypothetical protein